MADSEHILLIRQGVTVWNHWRQANPNVRPDLVEASLRGLAAHDIDLSSANPRWADLSRADLSRADLRAAVLREADLSEAISARSAASGCGLGMGKPECRSPARCRSSISRVGQNVRERRFE